MRIGMLTGGGDCPGLNAVIRAIVRKGEVVHGHSLVGYRYGWRGVMDGLAVELGVESTRGILHRGGTILGTSRTNPFKSDDGAARVEATLEADHVDALIAIGGEDTLGVAQRLSELGVAVVGVPKTIDNDLSATDFTFGFNTAVQIATEAIDRLHTTAESHDRVMVCEVMGRHAGWIATYAGMAGGADVILIPEEPFDVESVCEHLQHRHRQGANFSIVVVAEGAMPKEGTMAIQAGGTDEFGHVRLGGISTAIQEEIERRTGFETRVTILGHVLRGGTPTAYDRVLATRFGIEAIDAVHDRDFGKMVALRGPDIVRVPIEDGVAELKTVDPKLYDAASVFFRLMGSALEELLDLLELERLEVNLFRGVSPDEDRQRVFGGQVAAQALIAAGGTVPDDRRVHSIHAYFLRPGDPTVPIVFDVDRIRDGRSFTTRRVVAIQHGRAIFNLAASFQVAEPGPDHAAPMPDVPAPDELPTFAERVEPFAERFSPDVAAWLVRERPIDSRPVALPPWLDPTPRDPTQDVWIRANGTLPDTPLLHACVVAYASDLTLLDTAMLPHMRPGPAEHEQFMIASLDHAMWFHRPFHADQWLLYHQRSPSAHGARGLAEGSIYRADGVLAITVIQEGLIRPIGAPPRPS